MLFDEIDSGIGGAVANAVGEEMKKLSRSGQVIAITHLPQIAAAARTHFFVYKSVENGVSESRMRRLDEQEHVRCIAGMLSNDKVTDAAMKAARELIKG